MERQTGTPGINDAYGYLRWTMWFVFTGTGGGFAVEHLPIITDCILGAIKAK